MKQPITGLELSALGAVKYQSTSRTTTLESNQASAYRAGLDDKTIMDTIHFL